MTHDGKVVFPGDLEATIAAKPLAVSEMLPVSLLPFTRDEFA